MPATLPSPPHLYHRGAQTSFTDFPSAKDALMALDSTSIGHDVRAAVDYSRSEGADKVGSLGFCMGGTASLWCAAVPLVDSAVTYYGGGVAEARWDGIAAGTELAAQLQVPWLGHYGDLDPSIPPESVEQLRATASDLARVYRYSDAGHAFNNDTSTSHYAPGFCCPRLDPHYGVLQRNPLIASASQGTRLTTVPVISS